MTLFNLRPKGFPLFRDVIISFVVFILLGFLFYRQLYLPGAVNTKGLKGDIEKLNSDIAGFQATAAASENELKRLQDIIKAYADIQERFLFSKEQLLPEKAVSSIVKEVSSTPPGVTLISAQVSPLEDKGEYLRLPMVLRVRGDFISFGNYVVNLENSRRLISIENISMAKEANTGLSIRLEVSAYLMKEKAI